MAERQREAQSMHRFNSARTSSSSCRAARNPLIECTASHKKVAEMSSQRACSTEFHFLWCDEIFFIFLSSWPSKLVVARARWGIRDHCDTFWHGRTIKWADISRIAAVQWDCDEFLCDSKGGGGVVVVEWISFSAIARLCVIFSLFLVRLVPSCSEIFRLCSVWATNSVSDGPTNELKLLKFDLSVCWVCLCAFG